MVMPEADDGTVSTYRFNAELFSGANGLVAGASAILAASIMMQ
jgi:hypothetical protein